MNFFRAFFALLLLSIPVALHAAPPVQVCQANWQDPGRGGRVVPVLIRMPAGASRLPVILFSHGLGGSLESGTDWVEAWASAGFITVNIQHAGSDAAIRENQPHPLQAMRGAMNPTQLQARAGDVHFVIDQIARGIHVEGCDLGRADMNEIGMAGHSFGAETTLAVSGGVYAGASGMRDPRIRAAIAFSPQPSRNVDDQTAFGRITIPFFTVTGTLDTFGWLNGVTVEDRTRPFQTMPGGQKYLLIVNGATHMMLNGQTLQYPRMTPTPIMVSTIDQATTLFWLATLKGDPSAAARLQALGGSLSPADRFMMK